jgi:glycosyltransferase involved in cell wall biosynthesis
VIQPDRPVRVVADSDAVAAAMASVSPAIPSAPPLISVIMPCYNAGPFLAMAASSALGQTHGNVELILIDDGSTDASPEVEAALLLEHGSRLTLLHTDRAGPYPARNAGLRSARGEYIAFLDGDDWWEPVALARLYGALSAANADLAYCGWQNVGVGVTAAPFIPPEYEKDDAVEGFLCGCPWPIHAALVKRSLVDRLGGFSERRFSSMDYDFWLRALALTRRIVRVSECLAYYRWHGPAQVSAVKWRQVLDALAVQWDFVRTHPELVGHLTAVRVDELTEGQVLKQAYRALWKRDLVSAQKLFRHVAAARSFGMKESCHVLAALLPPPAYRWLVHRADRESQ